MFEKEAEEYIDKLTADWSDGEYSFPVDDMREAILHFAKFGYNKAKEEDRWHYPSKGELPVDEFADEYTKPRRPSAYKRFYCLYLGDVCIVGRYIRGSFLTAEGHYSLNEIEAWKEIDLPEEIK